MKFGIGQPMRRHEDLRLITGRGRYTDDMVLPRMTHAFVLRSPVAHAHIKRSTQRWLGACLACCLWLPERTFGQTVWAMCPAWCHWSIVTARHGTTRLVPCWRSTGCGTSVSQSRWS